MTKIILIYFSQDNSHEHKILSYYLKSILGNKYIKKPKNEDHSILSLNVDFDDSDTAKKPIKIANSAEYVDSTLYGENSGGHEYDYSKNWNINNKVPNKSDNIKGHKPDKKVSYVSSSEEHGQNTGKPFVINKKTPNLSSTSEGYGYDASKSWNLKGKIPYQSSGSSEERKVLMTEAAKKNPIIKEITQENPDLLGILIENYNNKGNSNTKQSDSREHDMYDVLGWSKEKSKPRGSKSKESLGQSKEVTSSSLESEIIKLNLIKDMLNSQGHNSASESFSEDEPKKTVTKNSSQFPGYFGESNEYYPTGNSGSNVLMATVAPTQQGVRQVSPKPDTGTKPKTISIDLSSDSDSYSVSTDLNFEPSTSRPYILNGKLVTLTPKEVKHIQQSSEEHELKLIPLDEDETIKEIMNNKNKKDPNFATDIYVVGSTSEKNMESNEGDSRPHKDKKPYESDSISFPTTANPKLDDLKKVNSFPLDDAHDYLKSEEKLPKTDHDQNKSKYTYNPSSVEYDLIMPKPNKNNLKNTSSQQQAQNILQKCPRFDILFKHFLNGLDKFLEKLQECTCTKEAFAELFKNIHGYC